MTEHTSARSMIDPELDEALAMIPKMPNGGILDLSDIPAARAASHAAAEGLAALMPDNPAVASETLGIPREDGTLLEVRMFRPVEADGALPALIWFHAGGQVMGSAFEDDAYHKALAATARCVVAAVEYRLAPETQAPGAAQDGYLAYDYLCAHAAEQRVKPDRIGIAGASGGGAIATAVALMIRDRGPARPRLLSLLYPMLDDRNQTLSSNEITDVGVWGPSENRTAWRAVLGDRAGAPDLDPYAAPGRAVDLTGLPDTFIATGQLDLFRDEDIDFAVKLLASHVPVELHVYPGAYHAFDRFAPTSRLTKLFEKTWHDFLAYRLHS